MLKSLTKKEYRLSTTITISPGELEAFQKKLQDKKDKLRALKVKIEKECVRKNDVSP